MNEILGAIDWRNIIQDEVLRIGGGSAIGMIVNSHSSGKFKLYDGFDSVLAVKAQSTFTVSSGLPPAKFAESIFTGVSNFLDQVSATAILTSDNTNVSDGDTVTLGTKVYTFKTALTPTEGEVLIGASADASLLNLIRAINHTGTPDTDYKCASANAFVSADSSVGVGHDFTVTALTAGTAGNAIAKAEVSTHLDWDGAGAFLTGGLEAETITIGDITYRWKDTLAQAYDVKIGATLALSLDNLKLAINGTGVAGTNYFAGTVAHTLVIATANADTTQKINSRTYGTANNTLDTTDTTADGGWEDTTLGGGTGSSIAGVATAGATFTINGTAYYFTTILSETLLGAGSAVANEILWVTNDATALDNMKLAINGTGVEGTDYSTGTNANADVIATTNGNTTQVIEARNWGTIGNAITTTEGITGSAWTGAVLAGGVNGARLIMSEYTLPAGSSVITFPTPIPFVNGLYIDISSGTADLTPIWARYS